MRKIEMMQITALLRIVRIKVQEIWEDLFSLNSQWVALNINQWSCNFAKKLKFGMKVKIRKGQFLLFKFKTHQFLRSYNILEKEICARNFVLFMKTVWMTDGIYIKWQKLLNYKRWDTEIKKDRINQFYKKNIQIYKKWLEQNNAVKFIFWYSRLKT